MKTKNKSIVATSTAEVEYVAMEAAAQDFVWTRRIMAFAKRINKCLNPPTNVENQGAIKLAKRDAGEHRTRHIDNRHHFV